MVTKATMTSKETQQQYTFPDTMLRDGNNASVCPLDKNANPDLIVRGNIRQPLKEGQPAKQLSSLLQKHKVMKNKEAISTCRRVQNHNLELQCGIIN